MLDLFIKVFITLFIAVGPIENGVVFAGLAKNYTRMERFRMALKACLIATIVLFAFPLAGESLLKLIDLQFYALKIAGGILLMILAIRTVMDDFETPDEFAKKHAHRKDLSVFPLAIPLIAGPATITQSMILASGPGDGISMKLIVLGAIALLVIISFLMLLAAGTLSKVLGEGGSEVLTRAVGVILATIGMDITVSGLKMSGLFGQFTLI